MKVIVAGFVLASMFFTSTIEAKKVTPPAPNLAASISFKGGMDLETLPDSPTMYDAAANLSVTHSFEISAEQEAALTRETTVTVLGLELPLSNDPNFQTGDNSATISSEVESLLIIPIPVTVKLKWGKGKMTVSVKGNVKEKDIAETLEMALANGKVGRDIFPVNIETTLEFNSLPSYTVDAFLACDVAFSQTTGVTAEGVEYGSISHSIKSKNFTTPIPD